ncbi:MAG: prolipoprotein diacylglyceryl transferase [Clostridia bacterium]|nr:prolipoprotein diacylglyceryl transferase [Clostridia bacterium]
MADKIVLFGKITLYPYSVLMVLGVTVCFLLFMLLTFKRHKQAADENLFVLSVFVISLGIALPASMLVDSLFKMAETGTFVFGDATFYGGAMTALAVFSLLMQIKRTRKVSVYYRLCDLAPCIPAGHFFGRIGCFLGGCCFGCPTDSVFGVVFPENSLPYNYYGGFVIVHPTQLYEAAYLAAIFVFLFLFVKKDGFPLYLILYGAGRTFIEFFRNDDRGGVGLPLSPAQLISIILIIIGSVILAVRYNRRTPTEK